MKASTTLAELILEPFGAGNEFGSTDIARGLAQLIVS